MLDAGYAPGALPGGIRARFIDDVNGLRMHVLEAGFEAPGRPVLLLLHGFPELAFSWRFVMLPLAEAGYHVIAPDQRGYGRTTGWDAAYDGDLASYALPNLVRDAMGLLFRMGHTRVDAVIGHDFGASVAAWAALLRPDVFQRMVLMSAPFAGPPALPIGPGPAAGLLRERVFADLHRLDPPRQHYQDFYCTREAGPDLGHPPQGVHAFLRAYYHMKSADWPQNAPHPLPGFSAEALAVMPGYYIMRDGEGMAATVAREMPDAAAIAACTWLSERDLAVYAGEYARTGFQGGLNWYRCRAAEFVAALQVWSGRTIDVPSCFIAGRSDWGTYQFPGALDSMAESACSDWRGTWLLRGAGHWVQQEQPEAVVQRVLAFLKD